MSWEQLNNNIRFVAFFATDAGVRVTGLADVTVEIYRITAAGQGLVGGGLLGTLYATEVPGGSGLYYYEWTGPTAVEGQYLAIFHTDDATVAQKEIPSLMLLGLAGVENLDATISSAATSAASADVAATAAQAAAELAVTNISTLQDTTDDVLSTVSVLPTAAAVADAVLDADLANHTTANTPGQKLGLIGSASVTISAPVGSDGTISLVRGDDYNEAQARHITISSADWPDLSDVPEGDIIMTIRRRKEAFGTGSDPILMTAFDVFASRDVGGSPQSLVFELLSTAVEGSTGTTNVLLPGTATGKYDVQATLATGEVVTLATGLVNVTEDQTRP